ncbi:SDR family oxidoreductase [Ferrimonas balearica]|uniref:SDR family oxidoreductase n=1 Tax=Ferrimonas balearica TaxID=44012 RepID=UPI001F205B63|nr:SDR family oxidoreductase [Ferrimonas balearica]MBY6018228.1 SDR family oxidoreductase [Halomonas denitrificans]MBY6094568.1 SDR family oxidoreductase [Ferrimonas balearica]
MDLNNKIVAITGGARGLGLAMAQRLGRQGARLALLDINGDQLESAVATLAAEGIEARCYTLDITSEAQVEGAFDAIRRDFGALNVLVNNAGLLRDGLLIKAKEGKVSDKMSLSQFQSVIDVNLTGTFLCGREAAALMIESGSEGVIINISSLARSGNMGQTNYSASKAGVVAMTVSWAKELARFGIRTGAVAPGVIATDMTAAMKPEALERLEKMVPVGRLGQPDEVAHAVEFILANDYFSGRVVEVDGGIRL